MTQAETAVYVRRNDPAIADAELAVWQTEGWGGGIGDGGTAYGPAQDHATDGRLPQFAGRGPNDQEVQNWAWSPEGIDYVVRSARADVFRARGRRLDSMPPAMQVDAIVRDFERPKNPNAEVSAALGNLGRTAPTDGRGPRPSTSGDSGFSISNFFNGKWDPGGIGRFFGGGSGPSIATQVLSPFTDVVGFLKLAAWLVNPLTWLRAVEGLFGFVLMLAGLYFIAGAASDVGASEVAKIPGVLPSAKVAKAVGGKALAKRAAQRKRQVGPTQRQVERRARRDARRDGFTPKVDVSRPLRRKRVDDDIPF